MIATLSRCTNSCKNSVASSAHEKEIAIYFCSIACRRVINNLKEASGGRDMDIKLVTSIAKTVCRNGGLPQQHPTDI
ncbi:unnamed protein product [Cylicostephanus goldi]|uniref:ACAD9/ACADV-like C-terminal domain-containing protein n=1 Tax=Cylicostephanus goldi TaxID=71465 RepID=A0A3P6SHT4_CYLGO|nr:unnamed protein product [Cylicostephanus goldi]